MIINLVGPPAAGKSTFAARFVLEHPQFRYCPIDEYRMEYENEDIAWHHLADDVSSKRNIVLESCGMIWRLADILNMTNVRSKKLLTIEFSADRDVLFARLSERQARNRPLPDRFDPKDEFLAIDHALEYLADRTVAPIDVTIDTTNKTEEQIYQQVVHIINSELLCRESLRGRKRKILIPFKEEENESQGLQERKDDF